MSTEVKANNVKTTTKGADLVVDCLIEQGVTHVFGIPGAKIDSVFDVLQERGPELIVCRHEQNAAFMAAAVGRLTGKPGVCLVTSGPGTSNLATGLVTATAESDPVVALAGAVPRTDRLKRTHQSMDNAALFEPITKYSVEVEHPDNVPEALTNAFRSATSTHPGATLVSLPQDVMTAETSVSSIGTLSQPQLGIAPTHKIAAVVEQIKSAKLPVILLGMRASTNEVTKAVRELIADTQLPVVETYQAAGAISRELEDHFFGRVGLFRNQPGDILLEEADLVLSIGYDPIEYDPRFWNKLGDRTIIHLDDHQADIDHDYQPNCELIGDIALTVDSIAEQLPRFILSTKSEAILDQLRAKLSEQAEVPVRDSQGLTHPLQVIRTLRSLIDDETTVACDIGSHYIWMARCFRSYEPRRLLFSNGMQTLGVALPWAIAATLVEPGKKVVSVSGDGGFLFSAMELETAVRLKAPIVHLVWRDGTYDMVAFQQMMKYGRTSATEFGDVDIVKYAECFGAIGLRVNSPEELEGVLQEALKAEGPVVVDIPIDYRDNIKLSEKLLPNQLN
ncbi:acetolactate synthase AlsS [Bacillus pseudomycoides]|uniref:Acetolactate synthase AlsS n=1 Tax=Bacillus pseudomycoides TaxID=64104 RepID=A0AAJ1Z347_9BACI|nr:acetolactate synthase AlsS [Bacillus pseudomycoides]MDR4327769.1 acetolactate synthase AlsS [Bacillus pseudomycoides]MED1536573.1 acetolactate synthase AlsS [Bacillus pseudomycoides]PEO47468.1 acetolactate synthase AlsS [Bacillus pseudomycoides]PFY90839.1 acetolactate synthase AlsS [Bacillus pseudomycoides]PFZ97156.1 acetolactate synthase AlsS [Bacillus pseudomycoides]